MTVRGSVLHHSCPRGRPAHARLLALGAAWLAACDPFHVEFDEVEPAVAYAASRNKSVGAHRGALTVMNYNVKFGGGRIDFFFDCHGDRVLMNEAEVLENLERIAAIVNAVDPDLLFLQEIDVNSKRSAYVDQMQWILDHTRLNHGVYASQWRADFVPSDGLGPVDSGNAILSRWPLEGATRYALPLREDQSGIVQYFYLRRNILEATVAPQWPDLGKTRSIRLVAVHAEAYAQDGTKKKHIEAFETHVDAAAASGAVIAAGDLNTLPPGSNQRRDFPDSACTEEFLADDFTQEADWLEALYDDYHSAIPLADYRADNTPYFSHTTSKDGFWNRTLDYAFSNVPLSNGAVLQNEVGGVRTMDASDHAPLIFDVEVAR